MANELARLMNYGRNKGQNALADTIRSKQYEHSVRQPIESLQGQDPLTDWGIGVAQRFQHPLEAMAGEAQRITKMSPEELAGQFGGGGMQNIGGLVAHTAWHGSPHLFDKFKSEAIGTGEGAQAFGHGLYLAENPEVAKQYQKALSEPEYFANGNKLTGNDAWAAQFMHDFSGKSDKFPVSAAQAKKEVNNTLKEGETKKYILNKIDELSNQNLVYQEGHLYKTDIPDTHIDKMLDWDKPLSQQHPDVLAALDTIDLSAVNPRVRQLIENGKADGQTIYKAFGGYDNPASASTLLGKLGIPGIKYLDKGSRTAGEGSRNFVMFNPEDIRILERNSVPTGQVPWGGK